MAVAALQRHELRNAFRLAVFRMEITNEQCRAVLELIESDLRAGVLADCVPTWLELFRTAEVLGAAHTEELGIRAMDLLHVAAARTLGAALFLTFDARQRTLARRVGLRVLPDQRSSPSA
jgi:predicted nucleic acid-binding protein